jgi:hypothetical protein
MTPPQTERSVHRTEHFPQRNEIENHRIKHEISRHDEKRKGRVSGHHAEETTLSRTLQYIDVRVHRRHFASVRIPGRGISPHSKDSYRLRTHVFPGGDPIGYAPKHL